MGCSGISWTICKQSAPRSRQITTPTPHHSIFTGQMLSLTPNQQLVNCICLVCHDFCSIQILYNMNLLLMLLRMMWFCDEFTFVYICSFARFPVTAPHSSAHYILASKFLATCSSISALTGQKHQCVKWYMYGRFYLC